ncbi:MAG TPA: cupin domain-containing protein [Thermoleophilaceae bacterium]|jgi:quercetin dioxygenase-like cupin family protein
MTDTLKLTPSESLTIRQSTPEVLEVEATYGPGGRPPPKHLHPAQDEHFEVLAGTLTARVGDQEEQTLMAGDTLEIPRGTPHQMWNAANAEARVRWETRPAGRTEEWFRAVDAIQPEGGGNPSPLAFAPLLEEFADTFRLALGPEWLTGPAVKALGAVGRLRDRRP